MASVRNVSGDGLWVPALNRAVAEGEVVTVPDDRWDSYVYHPQWEGVDEPVVADELAGAALDEALRTARLPLTGSANEKRQRYADWQAAQNEEG